MSVPTATGVLQGVAAFNWDGAAWQPAGRAGPSVPTPTGNLQGVAAFSGVPPQPTGRSGPGVATPTGVLDGVAVYTWSGAQWTPPGGSPTSSTPSGALRGVAAFDWDGSAWQPAGQAGPDVATPFGVLQGVARFNWTGSAWAATGAPSLSLDFMSTPLDPRITFTRASTATYTDQNGTIQTAAVNAPRWDYDPVTHALRGVLIEEARTNIALQSSNLALTWSPVDATMTAGISGAPDGTASMTRMAEAATTNIHVVIQNIATVASASYTMSAYAKAAQNRYLELSLDDSGGSNGGFAVFDLQAGTVTQAVARGTGVLGASAIVAVGNGIYRCSFTTTMGAATAGRVIIALSQTPTPGFAPSYPGNASNGLLIWGAQVEQGAFPTSYIVTTGATVTRAVDTPSLSVTGAYVPPGGSWFAEYIRLNPPSGGFRRIITISPGNNASQLMSDDNGTACQFDGGAIQTGSGTAAIGTIVRAASTWTSGQAKLCQNGGTVATSASLVNGYPTVGPVPIFTNTVPADSSSGYIRRLSYWPRVLSNTEMQTVTT